MDPTLSRLQVRTGFESLDEPWKAIAVGFLIEKSRRAGSRRTTEVYGRTVGRFLSGIGDPAAATPFDVHRFAYSVYEGDFPPAPSTISVRLAAVSGFYDFARRMEVIERNPAASVRRPRARPTPPRGLTLAEVARLLAVIPETPTGLLDRAITITALLTGLRRAELRDLRIFGPVPGQAARYEVPTKGGGLRRCELPEPAWQAIQAARLALGLPIDPDGGRAFPISDATFYAHLRRYSEAAGLGGISPHVLRHTAAKLRRQAGATIEAVSAFLGHRSIATTAIYLRQLEDERDDGWPAVAAALGFGARTPGPATGLSRGWPATVGSGAATPRPMGWTRSRCSPATWIRPGGCVNTRPVQATGAHAYAPLSEIDSTGP